MGVHESPAATGSPQESHAGRAVPAPASVPAAGWLPVAVARVLCGAVTLLAVALYALAMSARYAQLMTPCAVGRCAPGQATADMAGMADVAGTTGPMGALGGYAGWLVALDAAFALGYIAIALLIFWRRSDDRVALFVSLSLVLWGVTFTHTMTALPAANPAWFLPVAGTRYVGAALITLFYFLFPDGRFVPAWARWVAMVWVFSQVPAYFWPGSALDFNHWPSWVYFGISVGFLGVMVGLQVYRYLRVSSGAQRRQTKWVVYGIGLALAGYLVVLLAGFVTGPRPGTGAYVLYAAALNASLLPVPLAVGIGVLHDRLYDIDILINRSLIYGALTGVVVSVYLGSILALGWLARGLTGQQESSLAIVVSTLGVAALVQPVRRRIQHGIDRRFYRRRYNAARALDAFSEAMRSQVDLERLSAELVSVVERTMEPAHVSFVLLPSRTAAAQGDKSSTAEGEASMPDGSSRAGRRNARRNAAETVGRYTSG